MHRLDGKLNLSPGKAEKKSVYFGVLANHSPPTDKGRMFKCAHVTLLCLGVDGEGIRWRSKGKTKMKCMVPMQVLLLVLGGSTDSSVAEPIFVLFFGDNHGKEAGRDTNWASGGSAVTNSLLLSAVWGGG